MFRFDMFAKPVSRQILKIRLPVDMRQESILGPIFEQNLVVHDLVAMETVQAGTLTELVYSVELRSGVDAQKFLSELSQLNDNNKVVLITGQQEVDL